MRFKLLLFLVCLLAFTSIEAANGVTIKTVVIDAGHGGKDPGATGPGKTNEKDVALAVALKLGEYIEKNFPSVNIIYTRQTDKFIELHERAEIANRNKADLFIAIHCNSSPSPQIYGTSTYVLGLHRTEANLDVAKRENSVILLEGDRDKNYEFDPNSPEGNIIMSMKQNAFLDQSIDIASKIENQFETVARRKSLGVKQAGFYVLYKTTMPSLLSEIGFVSNPDEEKFLGSAKGQDLIASALFKAFKEYKFEMENREGEAPAENEAKKQPEAPAVQNNEIVEKKEEAPVEKASPSVNTDAKETAPVKSVQPESHNDDAVVTTLSGRRIRKPIENASGGGISPEKPAPKPAPKTEAPPKAVSENKAAKTQATDSTATAVSSSGSAGLTDKEEAKKSAPVKANNNKPVPASKENKGTAAKPAVDTTAVVENNTNNKPATTNTKVEIKKSSPAVATTNTHKPAAESKQDSKVVVSKPAVDNAVTDENNTNTKPEVKKNTPSVKATVSKPVEAPKETIDKPVDNTTKSADMHVEADNTKKVQEKPVERKSSTTVTKAETKTKPVVKAADEEPSAEAKEPKAVVSKPKPEGIQPHVTESGIIFKVQLFALKTPLKSSEREKAVKIFSSVSSQLLPNGITRYYAGNVKSYQSAKKLQNEAISKGYHDAFVVGFKNGERIGAAEMKALEK